MISRYSRPVLREIWTEEHKLEIWLKIELLAIEALVEEGTVPAADSDIIKTRARFDLGRCRELEKIVNHDVVAFTTCVSESINDPASRWFHYGLTSSDIVDTGLAIQLVESANVLFADIQNLRSAIARRAIEHAHTPCIGRSHGIHAEPTTFGLKLALMYDEFGRALKRIETARESVRVGKLSGAVGTGAHFSSRAEGRVCARLGLRPAPIATQVIQRDLHAEFVQTLALVAASIERWATEFRHLQRTEVLEVEEYFATGQKGSSAMPHKRNPITGERLTGLARVVRGHAVSALENVALWHERDISHSSVERIVLPDACGLLDYMLVTLTSLVDRLIVYPENMKRNLALSLGLWNSQTILLALILKGLSREHAYDIVQRNSMKTWTAKHAGEEHADFVRQLRQDPDVVRNFKPGELEQLCSLEVHFRNIRERFAAVGLDLPAGCSRDPAPQTFTTKNTEQSEKL